MDQASKFERNVYGNGVTIKVKERLIKSSEWLGEDKYRQPGANSTGYRALWVNPDGFQEIINLGGGNKPSRRRNELIQCFLNKSKRRTVSWRGIISAKGCPRSNSND